MGAFQTKKYRNLFHECGISEADIDRRLKEVVDTFFYDEEERIFHTAGTDMGYLEDTGNHDARTEGMSYGMMMCVQLGMKDEFDRIWKWSKTHMYMDEGYNEGYFAWSCALDGTKNADGPAPDGEEFYAMALFFASHRFGDGEGIFEYSKHAKDILHACIHKGRDGRIGTPMWNQENYQILFVPGIDFTDPSYHLPHFYELFALWAYEEDREFFKIAAKKSREYLAKACHPVTGLNAEYAEFDGSPMSRPLPWTTDRHDWFYSDAYRTVANIGLDYEWFGIDEGQIAAVAKQQQFLEAEMKTMDFGIYEIDGRRIEGEKALHPTAIVATTAQGSLASEGELAKKWVKTFFDTPLRKGDRRYYDNCLYIFAFLALSGRFKIWE